MTDVAHRLRFWRSRPMTADFYDKRDISLRETLTDASDRITQLEVMLRRFVTIYGDMQDGDGNTPLEIVEARKLLGVTEGKGAP